MDDSLLVNSFLPEAVMSRRSLARVHTDVEELHVLGGLGLEEVPSDQ